MHCVPRKITLIAVLLFGSAAAAAVEKGQPLAAALAQLRRAGLELIFSSALIDSGYIVDVDPGVGAPADVARRILASHDLTLEPIRPGLFAVVRAHPAKPSIAAHEAFGTPVAPAPVTRSAELPEVEQEVDVYASRYAIEQRQSSASRAQMTREELQVLPGIDEDVLRVTRFVPGTASSAVSARSHVRGGRDDELAVFFDGAPLFEPFHYKDVQSLLGILDPDSISKIDFFSGIFPARYGNRLSGVLDIQPRAWTGKNYNEIGASTLYSHALSAGRLDSLPVEWLTSVRRGNVSMLTDLLDRDTVKPDFLDALARVAIETGPRSSVALGWLMLDDALDGSFHAAEEHTDIEYRDTAAWAAWQFKPGARSQLRVSLSHTQRHTDRVGSLARVGSAFGSLSDQRQFGTSTARVEVSERATDHLTLTGGLEWYGFDAHYDYRSTVDFEPALAAVFARRVSTTRATDLSTDGRAYAAYTSALVSFSTQTTLDLGLRWDAQRFGRAFHDSQVSPRVSFEHHYGDATTLRASWGRLSQTQRPDELQVQDGDMRYHATQRAVLSVLSLERRAGPGALVRLEAYDKRVRRPTPLYENLVDPFSLLPELEVDRVRVHPDKAHAYGAELSLRWQPPARWSGWTSYTWSQAADEFGRAHTLRTWDQKHSVAAGVTWTNRPWQLSGDLTWHSGWRRNELLSTRAGLALAPRNSAAWPSYLSVDLRSVWQRPLPRGSLVMFVELDNATNHGNRCCTIYQFQGTGGGELSRQTSNWLPRMILAGITWQLP